MSREVVVERFFESLISGSREGAREVVRQAAADGLSPSDLVTDLFWPTYEMITRLYKSDQLTTLNHHMASRLLRVIVDQNALLQPAASRRPLDPRGLRSGDAASWAGRWRRTCSNPRDSRSPSPAAASPTTRSSVG
jgi:hypothetical protein